MQSIRFANNAQGLLIRLDDLVSNGSSGWSELPTAYFFGSVWK
ncbi:hypothetical protein PLCT2_01903 [Planctomycetaceae bacterium]|nr:hypothetical protein PLCT2_01903 [Planctomycetaceae bacterium]